MGFPLAVRELNSSAKQKWHYGLRVVVPVIVVVGLALMSATVGEAAPDRIGEFLAGVVVLFQLALAAGAPWGQRAQAAERQ